MRKSALMLAALMSVVASSTGIASAKVLSSPRAVHAKDLSVRIKLPVSRVLAGSTVNGTLIVTNKTDSPIELTVTAAQCRPKWSVSLTNKNVPPGVFQTDECGHPPIVLEPGRNRFPFALPATYRAGCSGGENDRPTGAIPRCTADGRIPDLPPGKYRAVLVGLPVPDPDPIPVRVVAH